MEQTLLFSSSFSTNSLLNIQGNQFHQLSGGKIILLETRGKNQLSALIRPTQQSIYGLHDPNCIAILRQLKCGLSKFNSHKINDNFLDTVNPMCPLNGGIEDTEHFLLKCHAHNDQRSDLLGSINEILQLHNTPSLQNHTFVHVIIC